ncbi:MAG: BrnT family toxin [Clostridia bacterium]|nr:BrnT family toxin [Clostridia bacterium]
MEDDFEWTFEWDEDKDIQNRQKHGISFAEAQSVFYDADALVMADPDHSDNEEERFIMGFSEKANLLVVCHCFRNSDTVIRIISARKTTSSETRQYIEKR